MRRAKLNIRKGDIRYCSSNNETYLIIGRTPQQKNAFCVLWKCGLRSHDDMEDIAKDSVVNHIDNFKASNKNVINNFIRGFSM